mmetsp:Transcript_111803/g.315805  ORF Transcript_111803/g.315805 Transcript_111803/m.315805 type:complete len:722 (-) Transcript_111803:60-2225(-)
MWGFNPFGCYAEGGLDGDSNVTKKKADGEVFVGVEGATSLKGEICGHVPEINNAATFRKARHLLIELGGSLALKDELTFSGFIDPVTSKLTVADRPFNVFARIASGRIRQPSYQKDQAALGEWRNRFVICCNQPELDLHWDSEDPKWLPRASMSLRHRFLTTKDLHWQWFNALVFGLVSAEDGGVSSLEAAAQVESMRDAALHYTKNVGGWSDDIGLFVNVFGHNNVNSLFVHILDMSVLGPSFKFHAKKNCPLDAVLKVLREEFVSSFSIHPPKSSLPGFRERSTMRMRNSADKTPFFFAGVGGATSLKEELTGRTATLKDAAGYREARRLLMEEYGGISSLYEELFRYGFVDDKTKKLTTGAAPFNIFARIAAGVTTQPGMEKEQEYLGPFADTFMVCCNRPENDEHWDSEDPAWIGKASMSRKHRFLIIKDLHWQWFNPLSFGLVASGDGGASISEAIAMVNAMKEAALHYATAHPRWSQKIGLFFHVFGHCSVNSLHLHMLDMEEVGPSFWKLDFKNCPLDAVLKVLIEEKSAWDEQMRQLETNRAAVFAAEAAESAKEALEVMVTTARKLSFSGGEEFKKHRGDICYLNVAGEHVDVLRSTLMLAPTSSFLREVCGDGEAADLKHDLTGRVFVNLPPRGFKAIIDYMRLLERTPTYVDLQPLQVPAEARAELEEVAWQLGCEEFLTKAQTGGSKEQHLLAHRRLKRGSWLCPRRGR